MLLTLMYCMIYLVTGSRICSFSPCIEQVQRTCKALQQHNFHDIVTVECLQRTYEVKKITQTIISFEVCIHFIFIHIYLKFILIRFG